MQQKAGKARHAWRWSHWKIRGRIADYEGLREGHLLSHFNREFGVSKVSLADCS